MRSEKFHVVSVSVPHHTPHKLIRPSPRPSSLPSWSTVLAAHLSPFLWDDELVESLGWLTFEPPMHALHDDISTCHPPPCARNIHGVSGNALKKMRDTKFDHLSRRVSTHDFEYVEV